MSGHNKWAQIKHQKGAADAKKSKEFSKLSRLISIAARKGKDPNMNSELRMAVDKAKAINMPSDNIERAIKRGAGKLEGAVLEQVKCEAYGPGGVALIIDIITDNRNRSIAEIKHILSLNQGKLGEPGSANWAFETNEGKTTPKITIPLNEQDKNILNQLIEALNDHDDVQEVYNNAI
jgi:YebC/PmpR family DNA-binding regulatory protein